MQWRDSRGLVEEEDERLANQLLQWPSQHITAVSQSILLSSGVGRSRFPRRLYTLISPPVSEGITLGDRNQEVWSWIGDVPWRH